MIAQTHPVETPAENSGGRENGQRVTRPESRIPGVTELLLRLKYLKSDVSFDVLRACLPLSTFSAVRPGRFTAKHLVPVSSSTFPLFHQRLYNLPLCLFSRHFFFLSFSSFSAQTAEGTSNILKTRRLARIQRVQGQIRGKPSRSKRLQLA